MHNTETNKALIFDIKRDCSEDGPGIRTTVFFKGCPLSCIWCQNPEGKSKSPQISYQARLCKPDECSTACISACEEKCLQLSATNKILIAHDKCTHCNKCFEVCHTGALEPVGYFIELEELLCRVCIDKPFYDSTGGGVTLSGGEVTQQMDFAGEFLKRLKEQNIHTAIETSGFFNYKKFSKKMLPHIDLIYFDLKLINDFESRKYTGQSSKVIFENFEKLIADSDIYGVKIAPRIPLIPEITSKQDNLRGIANYLRSLNLEGATLLPYNPLWKNKIEKLNMKTKYHRSSLMNNVEKNECVRIFHEK